MYKLQYVTPEDLKHYGTVFAKGENCTKISVKDRHNSGVHLNTTQLSSQQINKHLKL